MHSYGVERVYLPLYKMADAPVQFQGHKYITHSTWNPTQQTLNICIIFVLQKYLYNICTTSAQRLRRWSNIVQMLYYMYLKLGPTFLIIIGQREW